MKYLLVAETANHFRCIDMIIDDAKVALTEKFIKELHLVLKNGTSDSRKDWFAVGDYKKLPNEVGGRDTAGKGEGGQYKDSREHGLERGKRCRY